MKRVLLALLTATIWISVYGQGHYKLLSPDGAIEVVIENQNGLSYSLFKDGSKVIESSNIALILDDGQVWCGVNEKPKIKNSTESHTIQSPMYRVPSFDVTYNEMDLKFRNFGVIFRIYNQGVAYRIYTLNREPITIKNEIAEFNLDDDRIAYVAYSTGKIDPFASAFQDTYTVAKSSELPTDKPALLPLTIEYDSQRKLTILESDLESYPSMFLTPSNSSFKAIFAKYPSKMNPGNGRAMTSVAEREQYIAKIESARELPWRVMVITDRDIDMPTNNLVYALASPNRIGDYSWVEGGQSIWEWWNDWGVSHVDFRAGINMDTYKHYIDFASKNDIKYLTIDEGWYIPKSGNMMEVAPELDVKELVEYGKERGVDIILWCVFNVLDEQLEQVCEHYSNMGIKGFKVDFLDRDDQTAVEMVYRIAECTAKYKLLLDLHGIYKPTGLNRTYPNIINFESLFGMEEVKWSEVDRDMPLYNVTFPYIRMMAGQVDYTPGAMRNATKADFKPIYANPMSMGTRAHQIATYIVFDSPLTMLADNTTAYEQERESLYFITSIPTYGMDQTKILSGKLGEYIVTARQFKNSWFVGALTNWDEREVEVDFSFLGSGNYKVTLFKDGINANKVATDYTIEYFNVTKDSRKVVALASGGGFAMQITKI